MVNQAPLTFTGSSNVTVIVVSIGTLVAFRPGTVENTSGSRSPAGHRWGGDAEFRGSGGLAVKSAELLSMSLQPEWVLNAASVFPRSGAGPPPSKQVAELPYPTKSIMFEPVGQAPVNVVELLTNATLAEVAPIAIVPVASGVGRSTVPPAPAPSWTR